MAASSVEPQPISWLAAQKRPFLAANVAALAIFVAGALSNIPERVAAPSFAWLMWPGVLYYVTIVFAFLLPLWLVQVAVYAQMRQIGRPYFVVAGSWRQLEHQHRCRFLLSLRMVVIVLAVLYLPGAQEKRVWTRPLWLFLALFATSLLAFCLWTISLPVLPPLPLIGAIIFWSAALIFGLSHLVQRE